MSKCDFCALPSVKCHGGEMYFCVWHWGDFLRLVEKGGLSFERAWSAINETEASLRQAEEDAGLDAVERAAFKTDRGERNWNPT